MTDQVLSYHTILHKFNDHVNKKYKGIKKKQHSHPTDELFQSENTWFPLTDFPFQCLLKMQQTKQVPNI